MKKVFFPLFAAGLFAFALSACGGGGGGGGGGGIGSTPPDFAVDEMRLTASAYANEAAGNWGVGGIAANRTHWTFCVRVTTSARDNCGGQAGINLRGDGVIVAVVDDGIALDHPEFADSIVTMGTSPPIKTGSVYFLVTVAGDEKMMMTLATVSYHKVYGADSYTVNVRDRNITLYTGEEQAPLTLTAGVNVINNNWMQRFEHPCLERERSCFDFELGSARDFDDWQTSDPDEGDFPINPFTPEHKPLSDSHGTGVAGILAANLDEDGKGIVGVAPGASILPIRFSDLVGSSGVNLSNSYEYAVANNAFVANNSWGFTPNRVKISVAAGATLFASRRADDGMDIINDGFIWIGVPQIYFFDGERDEDDESAGVTLTSVMLFTPETDEKVAEELSIFQNAANSEMVIVFAHGNDGWNSETGRVSFCVNPSDCNDNGQGQISLATYDLNSPTIYGVFIGGAVTLVDAGITVLTEVSENQGDYFAAFPQFDKGSTLSSSWLNVVAVDRNMTIATYSNGCGRAKDWCLAAPALNITSAAAFRYERDASRNITNTVYNDYDGFGGTSGAAPHVSGVAALLKGFFPNISAVDAVAIIKNSANGLGICKDVAKSEYCVDEVYGHGMLNAFAAFSPEGDLRIGASASSFSTGGEAHALGGMRINLSPVFGAASWRHSSFRVGALDIYGRNFPAYVNFNDGIIMTKPLVGAGGISGVGVHAAYQAPLTQAAPRRWSPSATDALFAVHEEGGDADGIFGFSVKSNGDYAHRELRVKLGGGRLSWRYAGGSAAYAGGSAAYAGGRAAYGGGSALPADTAANGDFWSPSFVADSRHRFAYSHKPSSRGNTEIGFVHAADGEGFRQTGMRLSYAGADWSVHGEGGVIGEDNRMLGATFGGGLEVKKSATGYRRVGAVWRPSFAVGGAEEAALFASYTRTDTRTKTSGLLRELSAKGDELFAGLRWKNWELSFLRPLVVTSGGMRLSFVDGYAANGDYRVSDAFFDLSAGARRPQVFGLMYRGESERFKGLRYALGANNTENSPAKNYTGASSGFSAALHWRF